MWRPGFGVVGNIAHAVLDYLNRGHDDAAAEASDAPADPAVVQLLAPLPGELDFSSRPEAALIILADAVPEENTAALVEQLKQRRAEAAAAQARAHGRGGAAALDAALGAVNAVRARMELMRRKSKGSKWKAMSIQSQQQSQQQQQQQQQERKESPPAVGTFQQYALGGPTRAATPQQTAKPRATAAPAPAPRAAQTDPITRRSSDGRSAVPGQWEKPHLQRSKRLWDADAEENEGSPPQRARTGAKQATAGPSPGDAPLPAWLAGSAAADSSGRRDTGRASAEDEPMDSGGEGNNQGCPIVLYSDGEEEGRAAASPAGGRTRQPRVPINGRSRPGLRFQGARCLFPLGSRSAVEVVADDLNRLEPEEFLNDSAIDFYMRVIEDELPPSEAARFHFFSSFFFKKLTEEPRGARGRRGGGEAGLSPAEAAARRAHERVKNWTKGVDIFAKDYLFIPIHDAMHWSVVVVAFPRELGAAFEAATAAAVAARGKKADRPSALSSSDIDVGSDGKGAEAAAAKPQRRAMLLHLDSMAGGHTTSDIVDALRSYLQLEWERKRAEGEAAAAAAGAGAHHSSTTTTRPRALKGSRRSHGRAREGAGAEAGEGDGDEGGAAGQGAGAAGEAAMSSVPYRWALAHPGLGPLRVTAEVLPHCRPPSLPRQDNGCDCGLFLLAYVDFFTHTAPRDGLNPALLETTTPGRSRRTAGSPTTTTTAAGGTSNQPAAACAPDFLGPGWFCPRNAGLLRDHLRARVHRLMAEQAEDPQGPLAAELMRLAEEHDQRQARYCVRYLGPAAWREQLPAIQEQQRMALEARMASTARAKEAQAQRQREATAAAAAAPDVSGDSDSSGGKQPGCGSDPEPAAAAGPSGRGGASGLDSGEGDREEGGAGQPVEPELQLLQDRIRGRWQKQQQPEPVGPAPPQRPQAASPEAKQGGGSRAAKEEDQVAAAAVKGRAPGAGFGRIFSVPDDSDSSGSDTSGKCGSSKGGPAPQIVKKVPGGRAGRLLRVATQQQQQQQKQQKQLGSLPVSPTPGLKATAASDREEIDLT